MGTLDIDAVRQRTIAEGNADPIPDSPMTLEARRLRATMLRQGTVGKLAGRP